MTKRRPTFRAWQLARALRRLREQNKIGQHAAAQALRCSDSTISRIETAEQLPPYLTLRALLDLYGVTVDQWQPYIDLWERAKEKGWWHAYGLDDQGYVSMEADAVRVREFQLGYVPGLLQTEAYARAALAASPIRRSRTWLDNQVT